LSGQYYKQNLESNALLMALLHHCFSASSLMDINFRQ